MPFDERDCEKPDNGVKYNGLRKNKIAAYYNERRLGEKQMKITFFTRNINESARLFFEWDVVLFIAMILFKLLFFNRLVDGSRTSLALFASVLGTVLIVVSWVAFVPRPFSTALLYLINCGITFVIIADMIFFRYFNDVISVPLLTQASNVGSVKSSVLSLLHGYDLLFILDLLCLPMFLWVRKVKRQASSVWMRLGSFSAALLLGIFFSWYGIGQLLKSQPYILTSFYDRVFIVQNIGLLSFHGIDAYQFYKSGYNDKEPLAEEEKQKIKDFLLNKKKEQALQPKYHGIGQGKNLIVIQVEALQEFVINRKVQGQEITPNLNRLARQSLYFENFYCETAGGGTSDAEFMANVSLFPVKDGSAYIRFSGNKYYSMPRRLKEEGYNSIVMHAYKPGFWNRSVMYPSLGFDAFYNKNHMEQDEIIGMGLSDKSFFRQSLERLKQLPQPYYAFMITLTSHYPFDNDKSLYSPFDVGAYKNTFLGNYLEAVHYADEALGDFLDELEREGMLDDVVIALYGDHYAIPKDKKEELARVLDIKDMNDFEWVNHQKMPFLIRLPGGKPAEVRHTAGGGVDVMPTLLNIMGVDSSAMPMLGRDLLNSQDGLVVMRHGYFRTDEYLSLTADGLAFEAADGKPYDIEKLKKEKAMMQKSLGYSDLIIKNDLVEEMTEFLRQYTKK